MRRRDRERRSRPRPRRRYRVRHHIKNRCNGGGNTKDNLLMLWKDKEVLFHQLFGNRDIYGAIYLLYRIARAKEAQRVDTSVQPMPQAHR